MASDHNSECLISSWVVCSKIYCAPKKQVQASLHLVHDQLPNQQKYTHAFITLVIVITIRKVIAVDRVV